MAKRNSSGGSSNTLFNYFTKPSPTAEKVPKVTDIIKGTPDKQKHAANTNQNNKDAKRQRESKDSDSEEEKTKQDTQGDDSDEISAPRRRKRIRLISENSDESDSENKDHNNFKEKLEGSFKFEAKISSPVRSPATKSKEKAIPESPAGKNANASLTEAKVSSADENNWLHCRLDWLRPEKLMDANKRKIDHPEYDPKTLHVPADFRASQTPAHRQWWDMKAKHFDCVLFFKVGKFYELYHMDASVGVNELGFSYMKGDFAHSGFPEIAYARMANTLVQKGYRVARVEQTETPDMMAERMKTNNISSKDKAVRREICQVTCKGTEVLGLQDNGPSDASSSYMFAVAEQDLGAGCSKYGVCFIDTSIGVFHLGEFDDDKHSSRLLTTLAHYPPALVLHERGGITDRTSQVFRVSCQGARKESLQPQKQFWSANRTLRTAAEKYYQADSGTDWPEGLAPLLSDSDSLGLTPNNDCELAVRALGACIWFLTDSLLDIQIMEMASFTVFRPVDTEIHDKPKESKLASVQSNMVIDAITLHNLRIVGDDSSLYSKLNQCTTAMGKRLLHQWVCSPSCNINTIRERQNAISALLSDQSVVQDSRAITNGLPDMERVLSKIHSLGNLNRSQNHPDGRAIFYDEKTYSKRKVIDFISLINGFEAAADLMKLFKNCNSPLLQRLTRTSPDGMYPEYSDILKFFKGAFDHQLAEKMGTILPAKNVDKEYDSILEEIAEIEGDLEEYKKEQERYFGCKVSYVGSDKKRYQLEIPESKVNKTGRGYNLESTRKGFKRFSTVDTKELLGRMLATEDKKVAILKDLSRRIFAKFTKNHSIWQKAIGCIAILDVIISLAEYARLQAGDICVPDIDIAKDSVKPFICIKEGRHPSMPSLEDFIPNDTLLGTADGASVVLLTGPNMGGKSTLMRQLGLLTIMAQIGCHIPAAECSLTLVDRIFTRLGAHDDIMTGQSTFFVELSETAAILKHASPHSLVLIDELGRGTSTYDGTAIAAAVLNDLCVRECRTVFSTHYHSLVEDFKNHSNISLAHMACMVETDESEADKMEVVAQETVTFLYKLSPGACPKSYGFNAARLAGISKNITNRAHQISIQMEKEATLITLFKKLCSADEQTDESSVKNLVVACKKMAVH